MPEGICRSCRSGSLRLFVDLGSQPLANRYLDNQQQAVLQDRYPLCAQVCEDCMLVQVDAVVTREEIFEDYAYFSSYSDSWLDHARRFSSWAIDYLDLTHDSCVVEVASNDGYLLRNFVQRNIPVIGIEPAKNIAPIAEAAGVRTIVRFFGSALAQELVADGTTADLLVANNVLAHVPDLHDFVEGLSILLSRKGVVTIEFPHLLNLIENLQFDTIYHEHYSYLSLYAVERLFLQHDLRVFDVKPLSTHGGSLRVLAERTRTDGRPEQRGVFETREREHLAGLDQVTAYRGFGVRVEECKDAFLTFVSQFQDYEGGIAGYGAAAKGNTFLNYCGITHSEMRFVVDRSPHKQGLFLPGSGVPILAPGALPRERPAFVLILPWNLSSEVASQIGWTAEWGCELLVAIPKLHRVGTT